MPGRSFLVAGAILLGLVAAGSASAEPLNLGHSTWVGYGPLYVAQEKGYVDEEGVEVELIDEVLFLGDVVYVMTARPGRIMQEVVVDIPRPRGRGILTAPRFVALKRQVLALIREEAMAALAEAAPPGVS